MGARVLGSKAGFPEPVAPTLFSGDRSEGGATQMSFLIPKFDPSFRNWNQQWAWARAEFERYKRKGFSRQSLSDFLRPGMKYSKEHFIYLFYAPPKHRMGTKKTLLTGWKPEIGETLYDKRTRREIEVDIASRALTAAMEGEQAPLEFFTAFFLRLPPAWYIHVAEELYYKKGFWDAPHVEKPLGYLHKISKQRKAVRDQQKAEEGLFHELIRETSSHLPPEPFGEDFVLHRYISYDTAPPSKEGNTDVCPAEESVGLEQMYEILTETNISRELLELLKTYVNFDCKSHHEAAQILGWNEQQYQRAKKELYRKRPDLASNLKK
jgi:hypothetical protein